MGINKEYAELLAKSHFYSEIEPTDKQARLAVIQIGIFSFFIICQYMTLEILMETCFLIDLEMLYRPLINFLDFRFPMIISIF